MNLNDSKIVVAIENAVCNQLEASGITADPFRLDGEKIVEVILQQLDGYVLVPKELSDQDAQNRAEDEFNRISSSFYMEHRSEPYQSVERLKRIWLENKTRNIKELHKKFIERQEQSHD